MGEKRDGVFPPRSPQGDGVLPPRSPQGDGGDRRLRQAVENLAAAARAKAERHPLGHLLRGGPAQIELTLRIPISHRDRVSADRDLDEAVAEAQEALTAELDALLAHRTAFRPGRLLCLRCSSSDCEHAVPEDPRHIFAGYGPSGLPRYVDFAQWLLERQHPRLDDIYRKPPGLVTEVVSGRELNAELLEAFRDRQTDFHIHGQVVAGWYSLPRDDGSATLLALSFQILSSGRRPAGRTNRDRRSGSRPGSRPQGPPRRRLGLNVLGAGMDGDSLESLYRRLGTLPWTAALQWGQSVVESIEASQGRKSVTPELLSKRVEGLLGGIARRLEQGRRQRERRTRHAESRHSQGDRPTRMAHADLVRAEDGQVLVDERRDTVVVLGDRGRVHFFNSEGRLVTSVRYSPESIERRQRRDIWRPASAEEIMTLRKNVGVGPAPEDGNPGSA